MNAVARNTYQHIHVVPEDTGFGAAISGVALNEPLANDVRDEILRAWAAHGVVWFRDQPMSLDALESFTQSIGPFGVDPFIKSMEGRRHVLELRREPDEKAPNFGASWHSDWSFQETPPAATLLRAEIVPPVGGDTLYADGVRAYEALSPVMKRLLEGLEAIHSASLAYGTKGFFAKETEKRTMQIIVSEEAEKTCAHPIVRTHPVTGRKALYVSPTYTVGGIVGMTAEESRALLGFLFAHMVREEFVHRHKWTKDALIMWDNRCTLHFADGGYDGYLRVMHRTTVAGERPF